MKIYHYKKGGGRTSFSHAEAVKAGGGGTKCFEVVLHGSLKS